MANVLLLANDRVGVEVADFIVKSSDTVSFLCLPEADKQKMAGEILAASACAPDRVFAVGKGIEPALLERFRAERPDYIITVYWPYLISPELIATAKKGTVNFHPALLPINRGWFPHVHSFLDGTPFGVTLHAISAAADAGPIWAQKEVVVEETDTAGSAYVKLQDEIIRLFRENWEKIKSGAGPDIIQDESKAVYHKKGEIALLDSVDLDKMTARQLLRTLKARTFNDRGFAYYLDGNGNKVYMNLRLSRSSDFK